MLWEVRCRLCTQELVVAKLPRLHQHFGKLGCDMTIIATDWFLCLFSTSLPAEVGLSLLLPSAISQQHAKNGTLID